MKWETSVVQQDLESIAEHSPMPKESKNFLVTGGTGMLLKYLPTVLLDKRFTSKTVDHTIFLLVRNVEKAHAEFINLIDNQNFKILPLRQGWQDGLTQPIDVLIHGAGVGSPTQAVSPNDDIATPNVALTKDLLEFARYQNLSSFIFLSSGIIYGSNSGVRTVSENDTLEQKHSGLLETYQDAKIGAEHTGKEFHRKFGVPFKIIRPGHCYGPTSDLYTDNRLASYLIRSALVDKKIQFNGNILCMRSFVYISDAVSALFYLENDGKPGEAYNLFSSKDFISVKVFIDKLSLLVDGITINTQHALTAREGLYMNPDKLEATGWFPRVNIQDGLARTLKHFSENS